MTALQDASHSSAATVRDAFSGERGGESRGGSRVVVGQRKAIEELELGVSRAVRRLSHATAGQN